MPPEQRPSRRLQRDITQIDVQALAQKTLSGNEQAQTTFFSFLRNFLIRSFPEDIIQDTLERTIKALPKFSPQDPEKTYEENLFDLVFTIGKNRTVDLRRRQIKTTPLEDWHLNRNHSDREESNEGYDITNETVINVLINNFPDLTKKKWFSAFNLKTEGKNLSQIAQLLGLKLGVVKTYITYARTAVEDNILAPAGFKSVPKRYRPQAFIGSLRTIKILGRYYLREEDIKSYVNKPAEKGMLDQGYVRLHSSTTAREYAKLQYSGRVVRAHGGLYIKREDLEEYKNTPKKTPKYCPEPSYERLVELTSDSGQYKRANYAAKRGKLRLLKFRGVNFVDKEEFGKWQKEDEINRATSS